MAKTSLKDRVTTLLRRLGGSADEVAQKLRRRRIKGHRLAAGSCPVANYLRAKIPNATQVNVGTTIVDVTTPGEAYWDANGMPAACTEFVKKFDGLRYPDLVGQNYGRPPAQKPTPNPKETDGRTMTETKKPKTTGEIVDRVRRLLKGLGGSADAVAQKLRRRRIKGLRKVAGFCPIANYLKGQLPKGTAVKVFQSGVKVAGTDQRVEWTVNPPPCVEFVEKFDRGEILDLVFDTGKTPDLVQTV